MLAYSSDYTDQIDQIAQLFSETFAQSEGPAEGTLVGTLARGLMGKTPAEDIVVVSAFDGDVLAGAIIFSRLRFDNDPRKVFILAPVAVAPSHQGKGVGTSLLKHGLKVLGTLGVDVVITYGDPNYYSKVGFKQIDPETVRPPFVLSQPEGWLGQSLTEQPMVPFDGPASCVESLARPEYW